MTVALDHAVFDAVVRDVHDAAAQLERTLSEAARRVNAFLGSGWTGVAAEAFAEAWADWAAAAGDLRAGLADIAELLDATHVDLTTRDRNSEATLTGLAPRLHERLG